MCVPPRRDVKKMISSSAVLSAGVAQISDATARTVSILRSAACLNSLDSTRNLMQMPRRGPRMPWESGIPVLNVFRLGARHVLCQAGLSSAPGIYDIIHVGFRV